MQDFTIHHLRVEAIAKTPVLLNQHKGSAIRGALFHALRGPRRPSRDGYTGFCTNKAAANCWHCPLHHACPVSTLVTTLDEKSPQSPGHGRNAPRPYIIRPPRDIGKTHYRPGELFSFDLALCAEALTLFPYVILALERFGHAGLGKRGPLNDYQRGRLQITRMSAIQPLTGEMEEIRAAGEQKVKLPNLPATHADVMEIAERLPRNGTLEIHFRTPTRIVHQGRTLKSPLFRPLFHRLITRLEQLSNRFTSTPLQLDVPPLLDLAEKVRLVQNRTRWVELESYSTRLRRATPIGGLMGTAVYEAKSWSPFLPWIVWGTLIGVGKNTVKGDGWYTIEE